MIVGTALAFELIDLSKEKFGIDFNVTDATSSAAGVFLGLTEPVTASMPIVQVFSGVNTFVDAMKQLLPPEIRDLFNVTFEQADNGNYQIFFDLIWGISWQDTGTQLDVELDLSPLGDISGTANLSISASSTFLFNFGAELGTTPGNLTIMGFLPAGFTYQNYSSGSGGQFILMVQRNGDISATNYTISFPGFSAGSFLHTLQQV